MTDILLTSDKFVKSMTNISDNLCDKFMQPAIRESQDMDLQQVIGSKMLKKLQQLVGDGSIRSLDNTYYKELLDKAQYFMAYATVAKMVFTASTKLSNTGVFQTSDENVAPYSLGDILRIKDEYVNKADHYKMLLQQWILANVAHLPEISEYTANEIRSNLYSAASCGIWLGGVRGKGYYARNLREKYSNTDYCS